MVVAVVLAVALGVARTDGDEPERSASAPTLTAFDEAGDSTAFAAPPAREPVTPEAWAEVLPRLQKAVDAPDADPADRRRLAIALYNLGRLDEAEAVLRSLLAEGEDPVVRNRLGNVLRDLGDLAGAEEAYRLALATDPTLPAPYINLAQLLWQLHRDDEAVELLRRGVGAVAEEARPPLERALAGLTATTTTS